MAKSTVTVMGTAAMITMARTTTLMTARTRTRARTTMAVAAAFLPDRQ